MRLTRYGWTQGPAWTPIRISLPSLFPFLSPSPPFSFLLHFCSSLAPIPQPLILSSFSLSLSPFSTVPPAPLPPLPANFCFRVAARFSVWSPLCTLPSPLSALTPHTPVLHTSHPFLSSPRSVSLCPALCLLPSLLPFLLTLCPSHSVLPRMLTLF